MRTRIQDVLAHYIARFADRQPDWDAFADARMESYRRAQHRYIGAGASGKPDPHAIPPHHFTMSVMFMPPGHGNPAHSHEVEEVLFVLEGKVKVFFQDESGERADAELGRWDCVSCPANVVHGLENVGAEPAYVQVMLGKAQPALMSYTDAELERRSDEHLTARISTIELAASLAHELNQPLTAILTNAQAGQRLAEAAPADLEGIREILKDIALDDDRACQVIQRLRALAKREPPEFGALDVAVIMREVVARLQRDVPLCSIALDIKPGLPPVWGDRIELQQVALNLLLNAFDAMKERPVDERRVVVRAEQDGARMVRVAVRDEGTGLGDAVDRVFQPFYTTKRDGLGMGLPICRSVVAAHGGRLWAENNADRGATFYFTLPVARA